MSLSWFLTLVLLVGQTEAQNCAPIPKVTELSRTSPPGFNLARNRPTCQSSIYPHEIIGSADKAVDGECSGDYYQGSCTHTKGESNPWWYVDLGSSYAVSAVIVYNRADCCSERLQGAEVRVGDSLTEGGRANALCGTIDEPTSAGNTLRCNWLKGRYVSVRVPRESAALTLCEVQVYGLASENQCEASWSSAGQA